MRTRQVPKKSNRKQSKKCAKPVAEKHTESEKLTRKQRMNQVSKEQLNISEVKTATILGSRPLPANLKSILGQERQNAYLVKMNNGEEHELYVCQLSDNILAHIKSLSDKEEELKDKQREETQKAKVNAQQSIDDNFERYVNTFIEDDTEESNVETPILPESNPDPNTFFESDNNSNGDVDDEIIDEDINELVPEIAYAQSPVDSMQVLNALESRIIAIEEDMRQVKQVKQSLSSILNDASKQLLPYTFIPEGCDWNDFVKSHFSFQYVTDDGQIIRQ